MNWRDGDWRLLVLGVLCVLGAAIFAIVMR